jgi:hypothetical protein
VSSYDFCPRCGQPAGKLLEPLPGETQPQYALRMRREWKRETTRPKRRRDRDERELEEEIYAVLGVRE